HQRGGQDHGAEQIEMGKRIQRHPAERPRRRIAEPLGRPRMGRFVKRRQEQDQQQLDGPQEQLVRGQRPPPPSTPLSTAKRGGGGSGSNSPRHRPLAFARTARALPRAPSRTKATGSAARFAATKISRASGPP